MKQSELEQMAKDFCSKEFWPQKDGRDELLSTEEVWMRGFRAALEYVKEVLKIIREQGQRMSEEGWKNERERAIIESDLLTTDFIMMWITIEEGEVESK